MSSFVTMEDAETKLRDIIERLIPGEEMFITDHDQVVARLIATPKASSEPRQFGTLRGTVLYMAPDFDAPLEDFKEYME